MLACMASQRRHVIKRTLRRMALRVVEKVCLRGLAARGSRAHAAKLARRALFNFKAHARREARRRAAARLGAMRGWRGARLGLLAWRGWHALRRWRTAHLASVALVYRVGQQGQVRTRYLHHP